ncbi:MAG: aspartyl/asparaginyl beta-hydroxylase domain-containing protein [Gammaproteobacteria bacterium]|nr:aspartyl/asparaginyl beta-hydroxylase domain-containing protein [Gammaproteobacteria bacterium]
MKAKSAVHRFARYIVNRHGGWIRDVVNRLVSRYSKIGDPEVFEAAAFPWTIELEAGWQTIRDEALAILALRNCIPPLGEISPDHTRLDHRRSWRTFFLWGYGYRIDDNCLHAPVTAALVDRVPGLISAMFSVHEPGTHLPRHRGVTKGMVTCHLGLKIPADRENCAISVEDKLYNWTPGRFFVFDDTRHHEVWNRTAEDRVILLLHVKRPMRAPGAWLQNAFFGILRLSPFVGEAKTNMLAWTRLFAVQARSRQHSGA